MPYTLKNAPGIKETLKALEEGDANALKKLKKVRHTLGLLQENPRHPGLNSYEYQNFPGVPKTTKVWHSYVENNTPSAWRIWWTYGPDKGQITILKIGPHDL